MSDARDAWKGESAKEPAHPAGRSGVTVGYALKRMLLGRALISQEIRGQRLSSPVALGVLSPDAISSSAYGTEEILVELLPFAGLAAFTLLLPITGVILLILVLVAASYRQVVMAYTRAGGAYVVARDNFGPKTAQIASAALLIDYVVTVAVQAAAGTVAVTSAIPTLGPYSLWITIGVVVLLCYGNLRGIREAGKAFAFPTYFFVAMMGALIVTGIVRHIVGNLPAYDTAALTGSVPIHRADGLVMGATLLVVLRAFANGGSSLTGVEAISNTVSVFRDPRGPHARRVLLVMALILGVLVSGVSFLAFFTHATPYANGYPSVLSQEARAVFGAGHIGDTLYVLLQAATALILFTGANTSFNGFPFLASFVAGDRFLPRQMAKRGHRLVFSNGIIILTVIAVALLLVTGGSVDSLVPFYAIGVFTGFAITGYGMTKYHLRHHTGRWRAKLAINLGAGILSTAVVAIMAIAKFTEGAWIVVVIFPLLVAGLIRLNRQYRDESAVLDAIGPAVKARRYAHHRTILFVNTLDLATFEAIRHAHTLRPTHIEAVHFVIDDAAADTLRRRWDERRITIPLHLIDCPDRRLIAAATQFVDQAVTATDNTAVTVLLPRRGYPPLRGRLLHDRTADRLARAISRIPSAAATIVPFDVQAALRRTRIDARASKNDDHPHDGWRDRMAATDPVVTHYDAPSARSDATRIGNLAPGTQAVAEGRLRELTDSFKSARRTFTGTVTDATGTLTVTLTDPGDNCALEAGQLVRLTGTTTADSAGELVMADPHYEILDTAGPDGDDDAP